MKLTVTLPHSSYDIIIQRGGLSQLSSYVNLDRKVLVITDQGLPQSHIDLVLSQCPQGFVSVVAQGEGAKSMEVYQSLLETLLSHHFTRSDLVIGLGAE